MKGEFAVWFDDAWEDVFANGAAIVSAAARTSLGKQLRKDIVDGNVLRIGQGPFATRITVDGLEVASAAGLPLTLQYSSGPDNFQLRVLQPLVVTALLAFIREAQHRYQVIRDNGMAGGVKDWNMRLRFLRESNALIEDTFVANPAPVPQPEHWTPATAPCSQLLPYFNFTTKYISVSSNDCLLNVLNRHARMFRPEHDAFMAGLFPGREFDDAENWTLFDDPSEEDWQRLWDTIYDWRSLIVNENGSEAYRFEHRKLFRRTVVTDGVACSVIFDKSEPIPPKAIEAQIRQDVGEDDERAAVREAATVSFHRVLRASMEKAAALEDAAARGEIRLHVAAMDPGVGTIGTLARRPEGLETESKTFSVSTKKYYAEAGITSRKKEMERRTRDIVMPVQLSVQQIQQGISSRTATGFAAVRTRAAYVLSHLGTLLEFYARFRIDKFLNYRGKQIALQRMVSEILNVEHEKPTGAPTTRQSAKARRNAKSKRRSKKLKHSPANDPRPVHYLLIWGNAKVGQVAGALVTANPTRSAR